MNRNRVQLRRLLVFDERVRSRLYPNCTRFAAEWEVSRKTVQRDVDFLRDQLGAPLEYDQRRKGYSYSERNWFLPAIGMSEGDLVLLMVGARALDQYRGSPVAAEIDRIFQKIATMLPEQLTIRPETVFSSFTFIGPPSKPVNPDIWTTLVRGLLNRRSVDVSYRSFDATGLLEVKRWVLGWGRDVRVLAPADLRRAVEEEVLAMAKGSV